MRFRLAIDWSDDNGLGEITVTVQLTASPNGAIAGGADAMRRLSVWILWWMACAVITCFLAALAGTNRTAVAVAAALALAPAVTTLIVMPRWGETWAQVLAIFSWLAFGVVAGAVSGAPDSPVVAVFALAPALALWTGLRDRVVEATLFALLAFMASAAAAALVVRSGIGFDLGPLPAAAGVAALGFAGALAAAHPWRRAAEQPAQPAIAVPPISGAEAENAAAQGVAELSHELRTPLTHIIGFAEMMERQVFGPLNDRYREYAGVIRTSGAHLLGLVNDMLDLSRLEEGARKLELARFDARDIAREVIASAKPGADQKGVRLNLETPAAPLTVNADARALRQILFNTVSNAVKFSPTGGQARLTLRGAGQDLIVETADSGPGIPPEERERLGGRFVRGMSAAGVEGAGLGLAIVKGLAGLHGGDLQFEAAAEGGALVVVRLPVLAQD
jgi:signal transduction histidine kinase